MQHDARLEITELRVYPITLPIHYPLMALWNSTVKISSAARNIYDNTEQLSTAQLSTLDHRFAGLNKRADTDSKLKLLHNLCQQQIALEIKYTEPRSVEGK